MFPRNKLKHGQIKNSCNNISLERVSEWKLLRVAREKNNTK